ncbi:MAG: 3-methyl-2-oxobutanoate hydroxymethyltransferase [Cellvibrionales bacterium]|nr:3-methyl-2-oxobutanoate hydroxymethyltransferase [Cellvibrionales bacterium]
MEKQTLARLRTAKSAGRKFATLTAYDASLARLAEQAGIACLLIGDSLGNVIQGRSSTVPVKIEEMAYHTRCVGRGTRHCFLMADMPFLSYARPEQALANAAELMRAGAHMVKLEGGAWLAETVRQMSERGIPLCAHLGLLPQSAIKLGGYRMQGTAPAAAQQILEDARCLEQAGADMLVLECVPAQLAKTITAALRIPVIGIGAGPHTDSQVLVAYDALGISATPPKFAKNYLAHADSIQAALALYADEVTRGTFPDTAHTLC